VAVMWDVEGVCCWWPYTCGNFVVLKSYEDFDISSHGLCFYWHHFFSAKLT
jgi:hypothetical protein